MSWENNDGWYPMDAESPDAEASVLTSELQSAIAVLLRTLGIINVSPHGQTSPL